MAILVDAYASVRGFRVPSERTIDAYYAEFEDAPLREFAQIVKRWIRSESTFPTISQLWGLLGTIYRPGATQREQFRDPPMTAERKVRAWLLAKSLNWVMQSYSNDHVLGSGRVAKRDKDPGYVRDQANKGYIAAENAVIKKHGRDWFPEGWEFGAVPFAETYDPFAEFAEFAEEA
jgi:hypothetical protein